MATKPNKGPVFDPGLCRCCGVMRKCRLLNFEYEALGQKEIYSDMLMDCFGLLVSYLDGKPTERLICATCVKRLRDALDFRKQVLQCEEAFLQMKMYDAKEDERQSQQLQETSTLEEPKVEVEIVKVEPTDVELQSVGSPMSSGGPASPVLDALESESFARTLRKRKPTQTPEQATSEGAGSLKYRQIAPKSQLRTFKQMPQSKRPKLPMSQIQKLNREKDPAYMKEMNILTIVEYSYVCPFKCRHNNLICHYCGLIFSDPELLRDHTEGSHTPKYFKITEHKLMVKLDITRIDCRLCDAKIDTLDAFKHHIHTVHKKIYYPDHKDSVLPFKLRKINLKCVLCECEFPYFHALNKHMNEHFSNYVCETCGLGFVDRGRFMMHQMRHEEGDFPCPTCGKVFKAEYNRELHIDRVHNKRGRVYCPKCDVALMSYPQKLKHLVDVHGEEPLSFPCNMCERIFETRRNLTIHRRKDHLKDYRYECRCCGQKFFTRCALNNHMPTHTGERNFKCKVCEKSYPRLKTLRDHMRIHTNDRRYRCHVCGQAFIQNCSLKGHMKSQHPEYG